MRKVFTVLLTTLVSFFLAGCDQSGVGPDASLDRVSRIPGIFLDPPPASRDISPPARKVSEAGIRLAKRSEGFVRKAYDDPAGFCTVGYGHLIHLSPCDGSEPLEFRVGITKATGAALLRRDMEMAERSVSSLARAPLTDGQYAALCDFVFNVGHGKFRASTLLRRLNAGDFHDAPRQPRRWVFAGGKKLPGLVIRREREIELFLDGKAPSKGVSPDAGEPVDILVGE